MAAESGATASLVLFFDPQPLPTLRDWVSLLRPGGRIGLTTFGPIDPIWAQAERALLTYAPETLLDARTTGTRGPFVSAESVAGLLADAGCLDVVCREEPLAVSFDDGAGWRAWSRSLGLREVWALVPSGEVGSVEKEIDGILEAARDSEGRVRLVQQVRYATGARPR